MAAAFGCTVEANGKVLIKGETTTGKKMLVRECQLFELHTNHLTPPGEFSVSFRLPGPVQPAYFTGKFSSDGIYEGIVKKVGNQ